MFPGLEYQQIAGAPGLYFQCDKLAAKLSVASCADSYRLSWQPESIAVGRRFNCRTCPIGKVHAGGTISQSRIFARVICVRCKRSANRLVHKRICLSCYNRAAEVHSGRNARGTHPIALKPLWNLSVIAATAETVSTYTTEAVDILEVLFSKQRNTQNDVIFGRAAASLPVG